jgi:hypothetical protein
MNGTEVYVKISLPNILRAAALRSPISACPIFPAISQLSHVLLSLSPYLPAAETLNTILTMIFYTESIRSIVRTRKNDSLGNPTRGFLREFRSKTYSLIVRSSELNY